MMKDKNNIIDEDGGISILKTRLNGEQLDDDTINELMTSEKEDKKPKKGDSEESKNVIDSESNTLQTEKQHQDIQYNVIGDSNTMQQAGNVMEIPISKVDRPVVMENPIDNGNTITVQQIPFVQYTYPATQQSMNSYNSVMQHPIVQQPMAQQPMYYYTDPHVENDNYQIQQSRAVQTPRKRISTRGRKSFGRKIFDAIIYKVIGIAVIAAIIFLLGKYVFGVVKLDNEYMLPTYDKGETLITEKISGYFGSYSLNDIVIIKKSDKIFAARVIGCPGDTISINEEGDIYINGEVYEEKEKFDVMTDAGAAVEEIKLGSKEFFVLSDNRNNSFDSRNVMVGVVKKSEICGSVLINFNFDN